MDGGDDQFNASYARYKDGWYYWVNDSYARLKRMSLDNRETCRPRRLAACFAMEYIMGLSPEDFKLYTSRKRKREE